MRKKAFGKRRNVKEKRNRSGKRRRRLRRIKEKEIYATGRGRKWRTNRIVEKMRL